MVTFTWTNLEKDGRIHVAFIAFDNTPWNQVDPDDDGALKKDFFHSMKDPKDLDTGVTYEDKYYYLLDAVAEFYSLSGVYHCGVDHLPGGTHKDLEDHSSIFSGLSLEHFIIPSVKGWQDNHNQNDYPLASDDAKLVSDPRDAAAINIPVCDYLTDPKKPGTKCPDYQAKASKEKCTVIDTSVGANVPGGFKPGQCHVHIERFQKNEKNLNPLQSYQLVITIADNSSIHVSSATKQLAIQTLEITNSALPFSLIVAPGAADDGPLEFWYAD